jgi:hypothetical protein
MPIVRRHRQSRKPRIQSHVSLFGNRSGNYPRLCPAMWNLARLGDDAGRDGLGGKVWLREDPCQSRVPEPGPCKASQSCSNREPRHLIAASLALLVISIWEHNTPSLLLSFAIVTPPTLLIGYLETKAERGKLISAEFSSFRTPSCMLI